MQYNSATFNYVNPALAPKDPREPLETGLGGVRLDSVNDHQTTGTEIQNRAAFKNEESISYMVPKRKKLHNGRLHQFHLGRDGFELLANVQLPLQRQSRTHSSEFHDVRARYYGSRQIGVPLAIRLLRDRLGLTNIFAWHFVPPFVRQAPGESNPSSSTSSSAIVDHHKGSIPHVMAHNDYGFDYFRVLQDQDPNDRFLGLTDPAKSAQMLHNAKRAGRIIALQFWMSAQPKGTFIQNDALAICRPSSVSVSDLVTRPLPIYDGKRTYKGAKVLHAKDSPRHEWFHWPNMTSDEVLVWIGYDSSWGDQPRPALHSSFHHNGASERSRQSIEFRVIVFLDPSSKL